MTSPAQAGTKRKSSGDAPTVNLDEIDIPNGTAITDSCQVVRGKINRFIESGEMKVGEFCDAIGVSGNAYQRFMTQHGKDKGLGCDTYVNAWEFFKKREMAGLKTPAKKRKTAAPASGGAENTSPDLSGIHLEGEENDKVQVYDTCDEIRKKISAYLRKPGVTQAQFCRDLLAQYHTSEKKPTQIQSAQLSRFRGYKGPDAGNANRVFYAAYMFFEKMRVSEKKPKSKHRLEMEKIWGPEGGSDTERSHSRGYICSADKRPYQDQYGRVTVR